MVPPGCFDSPACVVHECRPREFNSPRYHWAICSLHHRNNRNSGLCFALHEIAFNVSWPSLPACLPASLPFSVPLHSLFSPVFVSQVPLIVRPKMTYVEDETTPTGKDMRRQALVDVCLAVSRCSNCQCRSHKKHVKSVLDSLRPYHRRVLANTVSPTMDPNNWTDVLTRVYRSAARRCLRGDHASQRLMQGITFQASANRDEAGASGLSAIVEHIASQKQMLAWG